jgi:hypothetical protein
MKQHETQPKQDDQHTHCCVCPYCDINLADPLPICQICGAKLRYCSECGTPVKKEDTVCPTCGATKVVPNE